MAEGKKEKAYEPDDGNVDIDVGDNEEEQEVEVSVSGVSSEETDVEEDEDSDEHQKYTAGVQKRIDRLTKKMREAERQREEALTYAKSVQTEADALKQRVESLDKGYMTEYGSRLTIEEQQVENELRAAIDRADTEATVAAQRKLSQLAVAKDRYETAKQQQERQAQQQAAYQQQVRQQPQQAPQPQRPDPKAEDWASKNEWFGSDEAMTFAAFGIHKRLVEDEGFDPKSDEYYSELDDRIRTEFPHKFSESPSKRPVQNVVGNSRSTASAKSGRNTRKKLTPSQVAIAKKLGVPLEEYAKYVK